MTRCHGLVSIVNILSDKVTYLILTLSEDTGFTACQVIGRTVFVASQLFIFLFLFCSGTLNFGVPGIPLCRVVHLIGQHVTRVVAHVVG